MTKIFIAGHSGMVGSALCRELQNQDVELVTASRQELDLTNQVQVKEFFERHKFDQVYLAAAKVGGINANNVYPAEFIYQNLMINCNIINSSYLTGVKKILYLGSNCSYPKFTKQPMKENQPRRWGRRGRERERGEYYKNIQRNAKTTKTTNPTTCQKYPCRRAVSTICANARADSRKLWRARSKSFALSSKSLCCESTSP